MVNNNNIPPVEEIRYLNTEIPTYEEFMKTYKSDENVSAGFENEINSYGDLGVEKGYGPCSGCSCACPRSDCNCQYGERWCELKLSCPICPVSSSNRVREWGHAGHSWYGVRISNKARIRCNMSYCRTAEITGWNFVCSNHDGQAIERNGSFTRAVLTVINARNNASGVDERLLTELLIYMETADSLRGY